MEQNLPNITVVLPVYNEAGSISCTVEHIVRSLIPVDLPYEILVINDGSTDQTRTILNSLKAVNPKLSVLHFSRNFGHMAALSAGIEHSRATGAVITMDSDGQHPPELLPLLIQSWINGADIVQAVRRQTADDNLKKRLTSKLFYFIINKLGDTEIVPGAADFRLMSRKAVDALLMLPEKTRFIRGLVAWIGFKVEFVPFDAPSRIAGQSKYSFLKMLRFAFDGIASFSTVLLKLSILGGLMAVAAAVIYALYILGVYLFKDEYLVSGWSSLMLTVLFMGGINLIALGILGEYISRIYVEVKNRPLYIIDEQSK